MDKKYISSTIHLNEEQTETINKAVAMLRKSLGVKLSRSQALAIFAHLYITKEKGHG